MCLFYTEAPGLSKVPSFKTQSCAQVPDAQISAQLGAVLQASINPPPPHPNWKITRCGFLASAVPRLHGFRPLPRQHLRAFSPGAHLIL